MAGVDLIIAPACFAPGAPGELAEGVGVRDARGVDVTARPGQLTAGKLEPGLKTFDRHIDAARGEPFEVGRRCVRWRRHRRNTPADPLLRRILHRLPYRLVG